MESLTPRPVYWPLAVHASILSMSANDRGFTHHTVRSSASRRNKWKGGDNLKARSEKLAGPVKIVFVDPKTLR
jgi:hypothetical protein